MTDKQFIHEPIRSSVLILILRLFLVMFVVDAIYSIAEIYFIDLDVAIGIHRFIVNTMFVTHILKNIMLIYFVISIVSKWISNVYYVTETYLIKHEGILNIKEKIIDLKNLRSVFVNQGFFGKLFHNGTITLTTSASGGYSDEINLTDVNRPEKYKDFFQHCLEKSS
jgi:uncharacterized membrane protein YdbT with pleckstrin-like domain